MKIELTESEVNTILICLDKCEADYRGIAQYFRQHNDIGSNTDRIYRTEKMVDQCKTLFRKISDAQ